MMELEKFKLLFFDKDQYILFQHLPKALIYDKNIDKKDFANNPSNKFDLSHMEAFWRQKVGKKQHEIIFRKSVENIKGKQNLDAIDSRLLKMLFIADN